MNSLAFSYRKSLVQSVVLTNSIFIIFHLVIFIILYNKLSFIGVGALVFMDLFLAHFFMIYLELKVDSLAIFRFFTLVLIILLSIIIVGIVMILLAFYDNYASFLTNNQLDKELALMASYKENKTLPLILLITLFLLYIIKTIVAVKVNGSFG